MSLGNNLKLICICTIYIKQISQFADNTTTDIYLSCRFIHKSLPLSIYPCRHKTWTLQQWNHYGFPLWYEQPYPSPSLPCKVPSLWKFSGLFSVIRFILLYVKYFPSFWFEFSKIEWFFEVTEWFFEVTNPCSFSSHRPWLVSWVPKGNC